MLEPAAGWAAYLAIGKHRLGPFPYLDFDFRQGIAASRDSIM
jgi:hypothetical protein